MEDLLAELGAINAALMAALIATAKAQPDPDAYLERALEDGLAAIGQTNYWSIPEDRRAAVIENTRARYTAILADTRKALG